MLKTEETNIKKSIKIKGCKSLTKLTTDNLSKLLLIKLESTSPHAKPSSKSIMNKEGSAKRKLGIKLWMLSKPIHSTVLMVVLSLPFAR